MNDNVKTRGRRNIVATWPKCFHGVRAAKHQKLVPGIHALSGGQTTSHYTNVLHYKCLVFCQCPIASSGLTIWFSFTGIHWHSEHKEKKIIQSFISQLSFNRTHSFFAPFKHVFATTDYLHRYISNDLPFILYLLQCWIFKDFIITLSSETHTRQYMKHKNID